MVGHNHPNGCPTPSEQDRLLTDRIVAAGEILGIEVLDHIVVAPDGSSSASRRIPFFILGEL